MGVDCLLPLIGEDSRQRSTPSFFSTHCKKEVVKVKLFGLSIGTENTKLGPIYNFSLPSITTCPGASDWCLKRCYAHRYERIRPNCQAAYQKNYELTRDIDRFVELMSGALPRLLPCFRIHVAGDFYSAQYLSSWLSICQAYPKVLFWTYSRCWNRPELLPILKELKRQPNCQVFASTDETMPLPPKGWRTAFVDRDPRAKGILCPEQTGEVKSCLDCGYCFQQKEGHVIFKVR